MSTTSPRQVGSGAFNILPVCCFHQLSDASTGGPGDDLVICAEVPGLEQDDIDISIENNTLVLRGERKRKTEFEERDAHPNQRILQERVFELT